jgi:hypothetical protein
MLDVVITCTIGAFTATFDGTTTVRIHADSGELLDTLLIHVASEDELRDVLTEWLRAS